MRRLLRPSLVCLLALSTLAAGCGGDDGGGGPVADAADARPAPGLVVGQAATSGGLEDTLVVVDPDRPGREEIDLSDAGRGIVAGPGRAFYESGGDVVLVDVEDRTISDLGLGIGEVDLAFSAATVGTDGTDVAVLLGPGGGAALVDLTDASVTDLLEVAEGEQAVGADLAPDESGVVVSTEAGVTLVPTADPDDARPLAEAGGSGEFTADGSSVLVRDDDGVRLVPVGTGEAVVLSEEPVGALVVGDRVALGDDGEVSVVTPDGEVVAAVPFGGREPPLAVGSALLVPDDAGSWRLVDTDGTVTELDGLDGLTPGFSGRPQRWVPFVETDGRGGIGGRVLRAVDIVDGSVVEVLDLPEGQRIVGLPVVAPGGAGALASVDDGTATVALVLDLDEGSATELGRRLQGASFAPDGSRLVWSEGEDATLLVAPVDDLDDAEEVDTGIALPLWLPAR